MQARKGVPGLTLVLILVWGGCSGPNPPVRSQPLVEVGDSRVVPRAAAEGRWSVGPLLSLQDGALVLGDSGFSHRSTDGGRTWSQAPQLPSRQLLQLRDGSLCVLDPLTRHAGQRGHFVGRRLELVDLDDPSSWAEDRWLELPVKVERWTDLHGDDGSARHHLQVWRADAGTGGRHFADRQGREFRGRHGAHAGVYSDQGGEVVQISHLPAGIHRPRPELALSLHGRL